MILPIVLLAGATRSRHSPTNCRLAADRGMQTNDLWSLNPVLLPADAGAVRVRRKLFTEPVRNVDSGVTAFSAGQEQ